MPSTNLAVCLMTYGWSLARKNLEILEKRENGLALESLAKRLICPDSGF